MSEIPYVSFSNEELASCDWVEAGDEIQCPMCGGSHILFGGTSGNGKPTGVVLAYECGEKTYLGAVANRLIVGKAKA